MTKPLALASGRGACDEQLVTRGRHGGELLAGLSPWMGEVGCIRHGGRCIPTVRAAGPLRTKREALRPLYTLASLVDYLYSRAFEPSASIVKLACAYLDVTAILLGRVCALQSVFFGIEDMLCRYIHAMWMWRAHGMRADEGEKFSFSEFREIGHDYILKDCVKVSKWHK